MDDLAALLAAGAAGDQAAFAFLVRETQGDVWRFCSRMVDADAVDDAVQETYVRVWRVAGSFRGESSARTWILAIARRVCTEGWRQRDRRARIVEASEGRARLAPVAPDATGAVDLDALVAGLDPERRSAFVLTQVIGLPYAEAARVCACPVGTIRSRVARARHDLVTALTGAAGSEVQG